jgi:hypothetical protein
VGVASVWAWVRVAWRAACVGPCVGRQRRAWVGTVSEMIVYLDRAAWAIAHGNTAWREACVSGGGVRKKERAGWAAWQEKRREGVCASCNNPEPLARVSPRVRLVVIAFARLVSVFVARLALRAFRLDDEGTSDSNVNAHSLRDAPAFWRRGVSRRSCAHAFPCHGRTVICIQARHGGVRRLARSHDLCVPGRRRDRRKAMESQPRRVEPPGSTLHAGLPDSIGLCVAGERSGCVRVACIPARPCR